MYPPPFQASAPFLVIGKVVARSIATKVEIQPMVPPRHQLLAARWPADWLTGGVFISHHTSRHRSNVARVGILNIPSPHQHSFQPLIIIIIIIMIFASSNIISSSSDDDYLRRHIQPLGGAIDRVVRIDRVFCVSGWELIHSVSRYYRALKLAVHASW